MLQHNDVGDVAAVVACKQTPSCGSACRVHGAWQGGGRGTSVACRCCGTLGMMMWQQWLHASKYMAGAVLYALLLPCLPAGCAVLGACLPGKFPCTAHAALAGKLCCAATQQVLRLEWRAAQQL